MFIGHVAMLVSVAVLLSAPDVSVSYFPCTPSPPCWPVPCNAMSAKSGLTISCISQSFAMATSVIVSGVDHSERSLPKSPPLVFTQRGGATDEVKDFGQSGPAELGRSLLPDGSTGMGLCEVLAVCAVTGGKKGP